MVRGVLIFVLGETLSFNGLRRACLLAFGVVLCGAVVVPVASAAIPPSVPCATRTPLPGDQFQPMRFCVSFDQASYRSNQPITTTVTITNLGTAPAEDVQLFVISSASFSMPNIDFTGAGDGLNTGFAGLELPPGATVSASDVGYSADPASGFVEFAPTLLEGDGGTGQIGIDGATAVAPVTAVFGDYTGTLATSGTDVDGRPLPRQPLAGATVTLISDKGDNTSFQATTDALGHFTFTHVPGGPYFIDFQPPGGWVTSERRIEVDDSGFEVNPLYLATRPLSESLTAAISFDDPSYAPGDTAHMTITLDNLTNHVITGVGADINPADESFVFNGGPGWAPFVAGGSVNLPPGVSTFHVSETVPADLSFPAEFPHEMFASVVFSVGINIDGAPAASATVPITGAPTT